VVIPHHYYIWDLTVRSSTLLKADEWVEARQHQRLENAEVMYNKKNLAGLDRMVHFFGDQVAFDKDAWRDGAYESVGLNP
jgi:hypothetical protein